MFLKVAVSSLLSRKGSAVMTLMAISVAIFVLLGIEQIRQQARDSFASTVSGVDLIVGAKTGSLNLLLYSVFRIGSPTDNISWQAYRDIADSDDVAWAIPISLGDSPFLNLLSNFLLIIDIFNFLSNKSIFASLTVNPAALA